MEQLLYRANKGEPLTNLEWDEDLRKLRTAINALETAFVPLTFPISIAHGGTNSTTALSNSRIMVSSGGKIVEASAITASRVIVSNSSGIPTHSGITTTQINTLSDISTSETIQTQLNGKYETPTGSISQYVRGDGSIAAFPTGLPPSGSAGGDLSGTYPNPVIGANKVTLAKFQQVATGSIIGRTSSGTGNIEVLTALPFTIGVSSGGTGITSYTVGDIIYASGVTTLSKLSDIATGNALITGGVGVAPSYGKIGLTTHVSGILPSLNGGTGVANSSNITIGGAFTMSGAYTFTGTLTGNTSVTFPTSGTLATTTDLLGYIPLAGYAYTDTAANSLTFTGNSLTSATLVSITSNSTGATGNTQKLLNVALSGVNATSSQTTAAATFSNSHTGTSATNLGVSVSATGASNLLNRALQLTASGATTNEALRVTAGDISFNSKWVFSDTTNLVTQSAAQSATGEISYTIRNQTANGTTALYLLNSASSGFGIRNYGTSWVSSGNLAIANTNLIDSSLTTNLWVGANDFSVWVGASSSEKKILSVKSDNTVHFGVAGTNAGVVKINALTSGTVTLSTSATGTDLSVDKGLTLYGSGTNGNWYMFKDATYVFQEQYASLSDNIVNVNRYLGNQKTAGFTVDLIYGDSGNSIQTTVYGTTVATSGLQIPNTVRVDVGCAYNFNLTSTATAYTIYQNATARFAIAATTGAVTFHAGSVTTGVTGSQTGAVTFAGGTSGAAILTAAAAAGTPTLTLPTTTGTLALVGSTVSTLTGTANQVLVNGTSGSATSGAITLTLPQSIGTGSDVQFNTIGLGTAVTNLWQGKFTQYGARSIVGQLTTNLWTYSTYNAAYNGSAFKSIVGGTGVFFAVGSSGLVMSVGTGAASAGDTFTTLSDVFSVNTNGTISSGAVSGTVGTINLLGTTSGTAVINTDATASTVTINKALTISGAFSGATTGVFSSTLQAASIGLGVSPGTTLHTFSSNTTINSGANGVGMVNAAIMTSDSQAADIGGSIGLGGYYTGTSVLQPFGAIAGRKLNSTSGNARGYLSFYTNNNSSLVEVARFNDLGYFGVSINNPTALIHTGASTTARASLCVPHGTAPTSPVDGDWWTTTSGAFIRINGVTKQFTLT